MGQVDWINNLAGIVPTPSIDSDHASERLPEGARPDLLDSTDAGGSAIRGSVLRLGGYVLGALASVAASAFVIRHLGLVDTGRYVTVMSLVVIAGSIADLGLSAVGVREYAVRAADERHRLLRNVLGMRLVFVVIGVALATVFAAAAGYTPVMVVGTVLAGVGMAIYVAQQSLVIPLHVRLRFGTIAGLVLAGQVGTAITAGLLAVAGAGLLAFFAMTIPVMLAVLVPTVLLGGSELRALPAFDAPEWRRLLRRVLPFSAAVVLAVLYFRVAQVMVSLLSDADETGYFGVSFRVLEAMTAIPALLVSTALPILARAARDDAIRFTYAARRLAETMLIAGLGVALVLFLGAPFCIRVVAGPGFEPSVDVLRILAFALVGTFVIAARGYALLSLDSMRPILVSNGVALAVVVAAGVPLIVARGAVGAAITLLVAELVLAACYEIALTRRRPAMRPAAGFVARVVLAAAVAVFPVLALGVGSLAAAAIGGAVYVAMLVALRTVPAELLQAFRPDAPGAGP